MALPDERAACQDASCEGEEASACLQAGRSLDILVGVGIQASQVALRLEVHPAPLEVHQERDNAAAFPC